MKRLPSNEAISFYWSRLIEPCIISFTSFQIIVKSYDKNVHHTQRSMKVLPLIFYPQLHGPQLVPVTQNQLAFNRTNSEPLGILPGYLLLWKEKMFVLILW